MKQVLICFIVFLPFYKIATAQVTRTSEMKPTLRPAMQMTRTPGFLSLKEKVSRVLNNAQIQNMTPLPNVPVISMGTDKMSDGDGHTYLRFYLGDVNGSGATFFAANSMLEVGVLQNAPCTRLFELNIGVVKPGENDFLIHVWHTGINDPSNIIKDPTLTIPVTVSAADAKNWYMCSTKLIFALPMLANKRYTFEISLPSQFEFTNLQITALQ